MIKLILLVSEMMYKVTWDIDAIAAAVSAAATVVFVFSLVGEDDGFLFYFIFL